MNSLNKNGRISGLFYLLVAVFASFAMIVRSNIIGSDPALAIENEMLFRLAILSDLLGQVFHVLLIISLFYLFKHINKYCAVLMSILALIPVPIAMLNQLNQYASLLIVSNTDPLNAFSTDQLQSLAMLFQNLFNKGVLIAQIFWGLWLFPLGFLTYKTGNVPKVIAILLFISGSGYLVDSIGKLLFPNYILTIASFTFIGELVFTFWLLIKGIKGKNL